ncbi:MAG: RNA-guided endonuclease InsQ/TnpB family protein, partial [Nitrososphaerales archaeon]
VRIRLHRAIIGTIKRATIIREIDQWFVALSVEVEQITKGKRSETSVGVDVGIANMIALSSGEIIPNPKFLRQST